MLMKSAVNRHTAEIPSIKRISVTKLPALAAKSSVPAADADVIFVFQDAGKKPIPPRGAYSNIVAKLRKGDAFVARLGSTQYVRFGGKGGAEDVLFVGMG